MTSEKVRAEYQGSSLLRKARMEGSLWDVAKRKKEVGSKTRSVWLQEYLGADNDVIARSKLLKEGISEPRVWADIERGALSYDEAYRQHKKRKAPEPTPPQTNRLSAPTASDRSSSRPVKKGAPPQAEAATLVLELEKTLHRLKRVVQETPPKETHKPTAKAPLPSFAEATSTMGSLRKRIKDDLYKTLEDHGFLNADRVALYKGIQDALVDFEDNLASLIRFLRKVEDTDRSADLPLRSRSARNQALRDAFNHFEQEYSEKVDFEAIYQKAKLVKRGLLRNWHPDRHNQRTLPQFLETQRNWEVIQEFYDTFNQKGSPS